MPYRMLLDDEAWRALNGQRVVVEVSASNIGFELKDGTLVKVAKATKPGHRKVKVEAEVNGQPEG